MKEQINIAKEKMEKTVANLEKEFKEIKAGRANPAVLNKVSVDYYGAMMPVNQLASVSVAEARILCITPFDKSVLHSIEKAIQKSDIGINPTNDGSVIRLVFPQLTEERRKELCKEIKKYGEEAKVNVRNARRDALDKVKKLKKDSVITEDDVKTAEKDIQKITDGYCADVDALVSAKEKEVMSL
jgi:ribosome recycling factor